MKKNMLIRILAVLCVLACLFAFASCGEDYALKEEHDATKNDLTEAQKQLDNLKKSVNDLTAAAATKDALDAVKTKLEQVEFTANAAATLEALNAVKNDLAAVKVIAEAAAVKADVDAAIAAIEAAIADCAKKADLDAVKTALEAAIAGNTADIEAIEAAIEKLASDDELAAVKAELATAIAGNTADIDAIEEVIKTLATKTEVTEAVNTAKTELNNSIAALETKLAADIKKNADAIDAINDTIEKLNVPELEEKVDELLEKIDKIDVDGFKNDFSALTDKLLDANYEYAYVKFVEIVLDIDDGPYDPDDAKKVRLQAENILFEVTRAISEDGLKALYEELVGIKNGLKTLEESLTDKLANITYVNTTKENIDAINAANKIYQRMLELEIEFENPELKTRFERIWNANIELNGDGTIANPGLKNDAANSIDKAFAALLDRDVKLGSNDKDIIDNYQAAIVALKTAIENSEYRDLYEPGLADGTIAAVKAEVLAETIATKTNEFTATMTNSIKADLIAAYVEAKIAENYDVAEDETKTIKAGSALENEIFALIAADLKAADPSLSDDAALAQAKTVNYNDVAYATVVTAAYAKVEAAANTEANGVDFSTEIEAKIAEAAQTAANEYVESDAGKKAIFVRAMAESLYNEDAAEAIAERYENMVKAAAEAAALVLEVITINDNWKNTGLLWTDDTAINAFNAIAAWVANASYKSANDAYIAAYAYADDNISDTNRDYVFGTYTGTITNYVQLSNVMGYVAAMKLTYDNFNFKTDSYDVSGVLALIAEIKKAVNGVDVDGINVLDVDNIAVDHVKASIAALDAQIKKDAAGNNKAAELNYNEMISAIVRNRITVIENAEAKLAAIITEIKAKYYNAEKDEWIVNDINAADIIEAFEKRIADEYAIVKADSIDPDYVIFNVTSSLAEAAIDSAYTAFEKFTEFAGQKYKEAKALIEKLEALGAVKLNHGKEIYDVAIALKNLAVVIPGLTYETRFPVKNDATGEYEMVDFYILQDKITNKYVPEYEALAAEAVAKAATLKAEIEALVTSVDGNANKLDNFNAIVNLMTKVNNEWLIAFYSNDMLAKDDANKYTKANNVIAAIKAAVAATTDTKIIGGLGKTYAFLANDTFASLETITKTAIDTYKTVEDKAAGWINDAVAIVNGGNYTFHDWDKAGKNFKNIEEAYASIVADYYIITALAADTDPDFGLYEAHETFIVEYNKCKTAAAEAATKIAEIENAINALGAYSTITLDNTAERRAALDAIYTLIDNFEANYCGKAQEDGDIDADLLFNLAKYDGVVTIFEYWASKKAEWPSTWNVASAYNTVIESVDSSIAEAVEFGLDKYDALNNFITVNKSEVDKVINEANN